MTEPAEIRKLHQFRYNCGLHACLIIGLLMTAISIFLENNFAWFVLKAFRVTPDGVVFSNIIGILILLPVCGCVILHLRKLTCDKVIVSIILFIILVLITAAVSFARGFAYEHELRRLVFEELQLQTNFIASHIILATWAPFLLLISGLFMIACDLLFWKKQILEKLIHVFQLFHQYPANPNLRWWCWLLGLAAVSRVIWMLLVPATPAADFLIYDKHAIRLANNLGYVTESGTATAYWPVGYPYFLSQIYRIFGHSLVAAKVAGFLLSLGIVVLTYLLGTLTAGQRVGKLAGLLIALLPSQIFYANLLASENLFTFLILISFILIIRFRKNLPLCFIAGTVIGSASLVRGPAIVIPGVFLLYFLLRDTKFLPVLGRFFLIMAGLSIVVFPWALRNYWRLGEPVVGSTNGGVNFFMGSNPKATGKYTEANLSLLNGSTELERDKEGYTRGFNFAINNPGQFLLLGIKKLYYVYGNSLLPLDWSFYSVRNRDSLRIIAVYVSQAVYLIIFISAVFGLLIWLRKRKHDLLLPVLIIAVWTLIHFMFQGQDRYHFPVMPLLTIFSSIAMLNAIDIKTDIPDDKRDSES